MIELLDYSTVNINGVFAGSYDEAYEHNPEYRGELWTALKAHIDWLVGQKNSFMEQLNECREQLNPST